MQVTVETKEEIKYNIPYIVEIPSFNTREEWLERATELLRPVFKKQGYDLPKEIRVACSLPSRSINKRIGEIHYNQEGDGVPQIMINPTQVDPIRVLGILIHELAHAVTPGNGHGKKFKKCATSMGLIGKMTATTEGPELTACLNKLIELKLGEYPHNALVLNTEKKQSTRMLKMECTDKCGNSFRASQKMINEHVTKCGCNDEPMIPSN